MYEAPIPIASMLVSLLIVGAAGVVRGFTGFGFSALCVAGLSLFVAPARVVPPIFMLEVLASLSLLRGAVRDIDWPWLSWLALGNALCIPLGIAALAWLPEVPLRLLIGSLLLLAAILLRAGVTAGWAPTRGIRLAAGLVSGFVNGVAAIGGIAVALLLSAPKVSDPRATARGGVLAPAALRATMIALFLFTDLYALLWASLLPAIDSRGNGTLLNVETLRWALWLAPAMLAGIWVGQRAFRGVSPARFRQHVLNVLAVVALLAVARALSSL